MHQAKYSIDVRGSKTSQVPLLNFLFASDDRKTTSNVFHQKKKIANENIDSNNWKGTSGNPNKNDLHSCILYPSKTLLLYVYVFNLSLISSTQ